MIKMYAKVHLCLIVGRNIVVMCARILDTPILTISSLAKIVEISSNHRYEDNIHLTVKKKAQWHQTGDPRV